MVNCGAKRMKIAIIGAGALGKRWAQVVSDAGGTSASSVEPDKLPLVQLSAFVDPLIGTDAASPWLSDYATTPKFTSFEQLDGLGIGATVIAAASPVHGPAVRCALNQGWHVLVEKPFTTSLPDAESLVDLAQEKNKILMVNQNYRFFPGPQTLRRLVASGELGNIRAVAGQFWCGWPGRAYQHGMLHPMSLEMAIHHFDLVRFIFRAEPTSGHVLEWNPRRSPFRMGGALEALFLMRSGENSFPFNYTGSLVSTAPPIPWAGLWRFEFDEATLFADCAGGEYALYRSSTDGRTKLGDFGDPAMGFDASFQHFLGCIANQTQPSSSGRDNLNTLRMALSFLQTEA